MKKPFCFCFLVLLIFKAGSSTFATDKATKKGFTKLLVGGGTRSSPYNEIPTEIIDLGPEALDCQNFGDLSVRQGAVGGLGFENKPMVCGGQWGNSCKLWENSEWKIHSHFERVFGDACDSPYPNENFKFFVSGGANHGIEDSVDVLTEHGWRKVSSFPIWQHCSVLYNSTTVLLSGGKFNNEEAHSETYFFNTEAADPVWSPGPSLQFGRSNHKCSMIKRDAQSSEFSIIVVGGSENNFVEILDVGASEWRNGPEFLVDLQITEIVQDQDGGVILIGGRLSQGSCCDTLFRLPHAGVDAVLEELPQKLKTGRMGPVAFFIPDEIANCTPKN